MRRGEERKQNGISNRTASILIPYSDAHSINIQLHQERVALSILLLFSLPFPPFLPPHKLALTHIPAETFSYARSKGLAKDRKGRREEQKAPVSAASTVYKVDSSIITFMRARVSQINFSRYLLICDFEKRRYLRL